MATKTSLEVVEDRKNCTSVLQESLAGAKERVKVSQDRVEITLRIIQELLDKAEELSQESKETAESAVKVSQEAIHRLNEIYRETKEVADRARGALEEAIGIAQKTSDSVIDTSWELFRAAREAIEAPEIEAKKKWWNG